MKKAVWRKLKKEYHNHNSNHAMGIKHLMQLIADRVPTAIKETTIKNYFGRIIAIDASMALYQFLVCFGTLHLFSLDLSRFAMIFLFASSSH
jgi:hypothetical protein